MPRWAKQVDEKGVRRWHKEKSLTARRGEQVWAIIWNLVFLWILHKIPEWQPGFLTDSFGAVAGILVVNAWVQIGGNLLMLVFPLRGLRYLATIVTEACGLVVILTLYYIFPFDFTHFHGLGWLNWLLPILLIISMVVTGLKILSNLWKLIFWRE